MAKARKDNKGRALRKGECQRKSDGTYLYAYQDFLGKRQYIYARDLQTLREKEKQVLKDEMDGVDTDMARRMTVNELFDRYIAARYDLKKTTLKNYLCTYDYHIRGGFGKKRVADVKYSDVKLFYLHLLNDCNLMLSTLGTIHSILHSLFQVAVRDGMVRNNPSDNMIAEVGRKAGKKSRPRSALTEEQQKTFMGYVAGKPKLRRWLPLFTVMFGTGCRIGELLGLQWENVDFDNGFINIDHSLTFQNREHRKCYFTIDKPKTEKAVRIVPMVDSVYEALRKEYARQEREGFSKEVIDGREGFVFIDPNGRLYNNHKVNYKISYIVRKYNEEERKEAEKENREPLALPHFSCHSFRHTFCARLCENEVNLKVIQDVMGHSSITTTMDVYAEVSSAKKKEALKEISDKLSFI